MVNLDIQMSCNTAGLSIKLCLKKLLEEQDIISLLISELIRLPKRIYDINVLIERTVKCGNIGEK
jgi:hypothetical protein